MPPVGFELTISAGERPKTYALDRAATGTSTYKKLYLLFGLPGMWHIPVSDINRQKGTSLPIDIAVR
jgi:hypothetical protein